MTNNEKHVMECLIAAFNTYLELPVQHPNDQEEFTKGIHQCQQLMALRIAREKDPKMFPTYEQTGSGKWQPKE